MQVNMTSLWVNSLGQASTTNPAAAPPPMASGPGQNAVTTTNAGGEGVVEGVPAGPFGDNFFLILVFVMVAVVGFSMLSGRKEKKRRAAMLASVGRQDRVQPIGGIIGRIVDMKSDTVTLETDKGSGSRVTISRQALQQVLETKSESEEQATD